MKKKIVGMIAAAGIVGGTIITNIIICSKHKVIKNIDEIINEEDDKSDDDIKDSNSEKAQQDDTRDEEQTQSDTNQMIDDSDIDA